ncbi:tail fiber protein [Bradyrhizobium quebecense]|uniref:Tail fiber protein n=1 Tax=Bradyrhizobium quebecense TaxID=2748629 RepID=A0A973WR50_9BRAD|nr:tail fiber protein [Bradyrhizobium quebecense]UGA46671.1 tail fiber protein [Bradyrhizobium quebecense]
MTFWKWSRTAGANATADSTCPFPEGMAPSALNDGTRGMMAAAAKYRDDMAGAIITTGTQNAYAVSSYQGFDSFAHMDGVAIAFTPHATNGATVTLNVDALGAKPLRTSPGSELLQGVLIQGTPYVALYNNTDGAFYLRGFMGNPYNIPLAAGMDYWGFSAPNSAFAFPIGQAVSRTTYASLFSLVGTTFGGGDGSTTFNLPDKRGRASVAADAGAGRISGAGFNSVGISGVGGLESVTLTATQIPVITSVNPSAIGVNVTTNQKVVNGVNQGSAAAGGTQVTAADPGSGGALSQVAASGNLAPGAVAVTSNNTGGSSHLNVQPSIVCNYIIRII